jgi:GntR family transcriptional repressor for pyruvate dehydrogenase complex
MGRFKPIKQFRISEEVLSQLKESILLGKFKSGEKLPSERELTEEFQVSRGVVREAIRILEITGFVTMRQGPTGGPHYPVPKGSSCHRRIMPKSFLRSDFQIDAAADL